MLTEFRGRLAVDGRADALLDTVLDRLKDAGLLRGGGRARTDSTHVIAGVRKLNRVELVGEGLRAALEEIAGISPDWIVPLLTPGWDERYGRKVETSRLIGRGSRKTTMAALAAQIGADGAALLARIGADRTAAWMNTLPRVQIMRTLWDQQFTAAPDGALVLKVAAELAPSAERLCSPYDPDARYSTKGRGAEEDTEWQGTKAHLTESCDDDLPNLITDVHTTTATDPDVTATTAIQDKLIGRGLAPGEHLMDSGYPSAANIVASNLREITLIAPVTVLAGRNAKAGTHTPADFDINWAAGTATCPAGAVSGSMRADGRGLVLPVRQPRLPAVSAARSMHDEHRSEPVPHHRRPSRTRPHRQDGGPAGPGQRCLEEDVQRPGRDRGHHLPGRPRPWPAALSLPGHAQSPSAERPDRHRDQHQPTRRPLRSPAQGTTPPDPHPRTLHRQPHHGNDLTNFANRVARTQNPAISVDLAFRRASQAVL